MKVPKTVIDDEYNEQFFKEPYILITTSRNSSSKLKQFSKVKVLGKRLKNNEGNVPNFPK